MKNQLTKLEKLDDFDTHLVNIIIMNEETESEMVDDELMDFDFDYDPNEMYYALLNEE